MTDQTIRPGISADAAALMAFESRKKSTGVTYLLWFFLGGIAVHRFYLGRTTSAVIMLLMSIFGWLTVWVGVGLVLLIPLGIWLLVDLFTIPGMVRTHNNELMMKLTGGVSPMAVAAGA